MKFVALTTKGSAHRRILNRSLRTTLQSPADSAGSYHQAHTYTELREQIHNDLRSQHPDWIQADGECPLCDAYEARLMELLVHSCPTS